jgi:hypothetical protein
VFECLPVEVVEVLTNNLENCSNSFNEHTKYCGS